jgi:hypothetical protein
MSLFRSRAERNRAERLVVLRFFGLMGLVTLLFGAIVAVHRLLSWW